MAIFRISLGLLAVLMIGVGLFLAEHFYAAFYSRPSLTGAFCDLSAFWNCDTATFSPLAHFWNVPTALFGVFVGILFLVASAVQSQRFLRTAYFVACVNLVGCLGLFAYSLLILKGLCPGCTVYYVCSLLAFLLFFLRSKVIPLPDLRVVLGCLAVFSALFFGVRFFTAELEKNQVAQEKNFVDDFFKSPSLEELKVRSAYVLAKARTEEDDFYAAPLRVSLFSDFQCPVCGYFAVQMLPKIIKRYEGVLNLQYFFYPIDKECHPFVERSVHPLACYGAYLGHCALSQFHAVHDDLYEHQNQLSMDWLAQRASVYGVSECYRNKESRDSIIDMVNIGVQMGVEATPTLIINERKIEGLVPLKFLFVLMDEVLKRELEKKV